MGVSTETCVLRRSCPHTVQERFYLPHFLRSWHHLVRFVEATAKLNYEMKLCESMNA